MFIITKRFCKIFIWICFTLSKLVLLHNRVCLYCSETPLCNSIAIIYNRLHRYWSHFWKFNFAIPQISRFLMCILRTDIAQCSIYSCRNHIRIFAKCSLNETNNGFRNCRYAFLIFNNTQIILKVPLQIRALHYEVVYMLLLLRVAFPC